MSTQRKIDSARANGAKSHGPITEEGRKTSSMNALKHGLTAQTVVLSNESHDEYTVLFDSYVQDLQPNGPVEMHFVLEMVNAKWRQRRLCNIESALFDQRMDRQKGESDAAGDSCNASAEHALAFEALSESAALPLLNRMESRLERTYSRALSNLLHLQRCRQVTFEAGNKKSEKRTESQVRTIANYQPSIVNGRSLLDLQPFVASISLGQPATRHECTFSAPYSWNNSRSCS
jgi:hypothetical protein